MEPLSNKDTLLRWHQLTEREQLVWANVFAGALPEGPEKAAHVADQAVAALKRVDIDAEKMAPEAALAKANLSVSFEEFMPWYRLAHRLTYGIGSRYTLPAIEDIERAYHRYQRSRCDFC